MINYGHKVELRRINASDLAQLRHWRNDPKIRDWCRQISDISEDDQQAWFKSQNNDPSMRMFAICTTQAGLLVGVCGLTSIDFVTRKAEFSCYIGPEHQKNGFAVAALKTLFRFGFDSLNLNLIWGETFSGNPALNLFLNLGMKEDGVRRAFYYKKGKYIDAHLVSILANEFEKPTRVL